VALCTYTAHAPEPALDAASIALLHLDVTEG
jgi:hypothetical protein